MESSVVNTESVREVEALQTKSQHSLIYSLSMDSINQVSFLKLYPKGDFIISKDGFKGSADSLVWYNNMRQVSKSQQLERQKQEQSSNEMFKQITTQSTRENKNKLVKGGSFIWYILGGIVVIGCVFLSSKMINKS
ncbi:hypothetical protein [Pedobacter ureilyticus]|uniref:Uncharacterized protein n=1 Tax=Pedobacter ureilyticus TaxID=1393051 RepID=A0ABW9J5F4_9SPHI|nr:hypothetical protein [Pedobacter helvus]